MKVAIPQWQGRVSPVFDVATNLLIAEVSQGVEVSRELVALTAIDPMRRATQVAGFGVNVLICGAISWPLESAVSSTGIALHPRVCGAVEEVLEAFRKGKLTEPAFVMPGCCGGGRRNRGRGRRGRCAGTGDEAPNAGRRRPQPGSGRLS